MNLPYHHDWQPLFESSVGMQVKWFGSWGNDPDWEIETSRLASDLICFFYLKEGRCAVTLNGVESAMEVGDLVVLRGGDAFAFTQDAGHLQTSLSACLSLNRGDGTNVLLQHQFQRLYHLSDPTEYERQFEAVRQVLEREGRWQSLLQSGQLLLWLSFLLETLSPIPGRADGSAKTVNHVLGAQGWARLHIGEEVTVARWASSCRLNVDYFSRIFKSHTGMGPKSWLVEARLQQASRLLDTPQKTVDQVAEQCGFNCPFHFSRSFKKRFGLPPSRYRQTRLSPVLVKPDERG